MSEVRLIDANTVDISQTIKKNSVFAECVKYAVKITLDNTPTVNAIEIPKDATNGDVIEIITGEKFSIGDESHDLMISNGEDYMAFNINWWDAPYKKGGEE